MELAEIEGNEQLASYVYLPATKADLLRRLDRHDEAVEAYRAALAIVTNSRERRFLERRLAEVGGRLRVEG
jgi:RNA polymerase sigma-70 factor (ECF subfamily)